MASIGATLSQNIGAAELSALLESDKFGIYSADSYLALDGVTDDYAALYALINTTINGAAAEIWFKDGICLISSSITVPSNIKLNFLRDGMLKIANGGTITGNNAKIEAGLHQIFDLSLGGTIAGSWDIKQVFPVWFGVTGDGVTDDTVALQNALTFSENKTLLIPNGTYMVSYNLSPLSDTTIIWEEGAIFQRITDTTSASPVIIIEDVTNVTLINPTIIGDKLTHINQTSQGCHGIRIGSALARVGSPRATYTTKNIKIFSPNCSLNMGDGIYINDAQDVYIENANCDTNHRMGIALISGKDIKIVKPKCINSTGIANTVSSGIDIEPNLITDELDNVVIDSLYVENTANQSGLLISLGNMKGGTCNVNIVINSPIMKDRSIFVNNPAGTIGVIEINNPICVGSQQSGIILRNCEYTGAKVRINNPIIEDYNVLNQASTIYNSGITIYTDSSSPSGMTNIGNIDIINPIIKTTRSATLYGISIHDAKNSVAPKNINIIQPFITVPANRYYIPYTDYSLKIVGDYSDALEYTATTIPTSFIRNLNWKYTNATALGSAILTTTQLEFDAEIKMENVGATTSFTLWMDSLTTPTPYAFYPFGSSVVAVYTNQKGASIKFKKTSIGFVATEIIGDWFALGQNYENINTNKFEIFDDFNYQTLTELDTPWILNKGSDAQALDPTISLDERGKIVLTTGNNSGTLADDGSQIVCAIPVQADSVGLVVEARLHINTAITGVSVNFGLTDSTTLEEPFDINGTTITSTASDAVCFVYDDSATTKEWYGCSVDSNTDDLGNGALGVAPVADTYQKLRMEIDSAGNNIKFFINNVLVKTLTGGSGGGVTPNVNLYATIVVNSTTTTSKTVDVDYIYISHNR